MIKFVVKLIKQVAQFLKENQIPFSTFDRSFFVIAKFININYLDIYGTAKFFVMFGNYQDNQAFIRRLTE